MIPGGFTGVDIFFVISGYLISGILYKGLKANGGAGNFSFGEFYARRVRRLFPALITVLLATMAYGWLILLPDEFQQMGKHVAAGTLFIQNIVFWQESGYFDIAASLKPLLHLWSLAVEEQFYIFFPPILLLIWKKKWPLAAIMGVLLIASMIGNLVMSGHGGTAAFFLTPYRAWEFLGGSLLAWWHYERGHEEEEPPYREALSWGGALLLALGMAFIRTGDPYPGWRAILPVAGTLLLMEGGAGTGVKGAWVNRKILSNPAVVWVGLISYPLYLFHWPALSFVHIIKGDVQRGHVPKPVYLADALLVSLILAALTYYIIERNTRHNKSKWTIAVLSGLFLIIGFIGFLISEGNIPSHYNPPQLARLNQAARDAAMMAGVQEVKKHGVYYIHKIGGNGSQTIFLGDSNMQHYAPRILELLKKNHGNERGAILVTECGVPPIPGTRNNEGKESSELLAGFSEEMESNPQIDRVVIASRWCTYFSSNSRWRTDGLSLDSKEGKKEALSKLDLFIQSIVQQGRVVYIVLNIPTGIELDPKGIYPRNFRGSGESKKKVLTKQSFLNENGTLLGDIAAIAKKNGAQVIDPMDYLCTNGVCIAEDENGIPIRFDDGHLRPGYVREHVKYLDETVTP
jgi:peptidoglycan/LPS O-acetylase OafA/YrhL